jgi:hypothetical protein
MLQEWENQIQNFDEYIESIKSVDDCICIQLIGITTKETIVIQRNLSSIDLKWDSEGRIWHSITEGHGDTEKDCLLILAPSLPMLVLHQLGAMKPSQGLVLCSRLLDFFIEDRSSILPINKALKGATIQYILLNNQRVIINFNPKHSYFHKSNSLEEGVGQLLNNYAPHVANKLPLEIYERVKGMIGWAIEIYSDFLLDELKTGRIGPRIDKWYIGFTTEIERGFPVFSSMYGLIIGSDPNPEEFINDKDDQFLEIRDKFRNVVKIFGSVVYEQHFGPFLG